ncbi:MAG: sigma factor-like helix-turn-helix DNA-binding protein [Xanthomonadales bacterium]|nr:sigma factor-like helix-turn-helix DNA-binding protein [Xanthomonadales bacterium]
MTDVYLTAAEGNLAKAFPSLVERCLREKSPRTFDRDYRVLCRRYGLDGGPISTLQEMGACYDITRERVRQIQATSIQRIRQLLDGSLKRPGWDIDQSLREGWRELMRDLRAEEPGITRSRFQAIVRARFGNGVPGRWFELFAEIMDFRPLGPSNSLNVPDLEERWLHRDAAPKKAINQVYGVLEEVSDEVGGLSMPALMARIQSEGSDQVDEALVRAIIGTRARLEIRNDLARVRTEWLSNCSDQAWRVLQSAGRPMHRDEIAREVNRYRAGKRGMAPSSAPNVSSRMGGDARFVCSGKSGFWGLAEWNRGGDMTIVEAMQKALHGAGRALKMDELVSRTQKLRPDAARNSIVTYSGQESEFVRVQGGAVALAVWNLPDQLPARDCSRLQTGDFLAAVDLVRDGRTEVPLAELVKQLADLLDKAEVTVRQSLHKVDGVEILAVPGGRGKLVRFSEAVPLKLVRHRKTLKREVMQRAIRKCMREAGGEFANKTDLYEKGE